MCTAQPIADFLICRDLPKYRVNESIEVLRTKWTWKRNFDIRDTYEAWFLLNWNAAKWTSTLLPFHIGCIFTKKWQCFNFSILSGGTLFILPFTSVTQISDRAQNLIHWNSKSYSLNPISYFAKQGFLKAIALVWIFIAQPVYKLNWSTV